MSLSNLTIVVPTRNEAHNISAFLMSLPETVPLIVVDSSDDNTAALIESHRPANTRVIRRAANSSVHLNQNLLLFYIKLTDASQLFNTSLNPA